MKKRSQLFLAFALVLALGAGGCSTASTDDAAPQAENVQAAWNPEPVIARWIPNSGTSGEALQSLAKEGGNVWETRYYGTITDIGWGAPLIAPVHAGHRIKDGTYGIDAAGLAWVEYPGSPGASDENEYLYFKTRDVNAEPVLLETWETTYPPLAEDADKQGMHLAYREGALLWNLPGEETTVKYYTQATGETRVFDTQKDETVTALALGAEDAAWLVQKEGKTLLKHADLASGAVDVLTEEAALADPLIMGDVLVVRDAAANCLRVYDLAAQKWTYTIGADWPDWAEGAKLATPWPLDARHLALTRADAKEPYPLLAADLESVTVQAVEEAPNTALYVAPEDVDAEALAQGAQAVTYIQPEEAASGTHTFALVTNNHGTLQQSALVAEFLW